MTDDTEDGWCVPCNCQMLDGTRHDVISNRMKVVYICPKCKKWEWG